MAGEDGNGGSGGDAGANEGAGGTPGGQAGGAGAEGKPKGDGGSPGGAGGVGGLSPDILPPSLRGKGERELKFILSQMESTVGKQSQELEALRKRLQEKEEPKEDPKPKDTRPYEERILDEPEEVVAEIVYKKFGGVIQNLDSRTARQDWAMAKREIPDFEEYEDAIKEKLELAGAPATFENISGAYTLVLGEKVLEQRQQKVREQASMETGGPAPNDDAGKKEPQLTDLELEIATAQGMSPEQWVEARDGDLFGSIKIPTGQREEK